MLNRLVAVLWVDAHVESTTTWTAEEIGSQTGVRFWTLGILVRDDADFVGIAAEVSQDGSYRGITFIPRSIVIEIKDLGRWPPRLRKSQTPCKTPLIAEPSPTTIAHT